MADDCEITYPRKRWKLPAPDPAAAAELAKALKTSPVVGQLLLNRGFSADDLDAARKFARPAMTDLLEPSGIPGLPAAAERLALALKNGEKIAIYGDYDVDGITATSILWHAFTLLGGDENRIATYVPHRVDEGYGLNGRGRRNARRRRGQSHRQRRLRHHRRRARRRGEGARRGPDRHRPPRVENRRRRRAVAAGRLRNRPPATAGRNAL